MKHRRQLATALAFSAVFIVFAAFKLPEVVALRIADAVSEATGKICRIEGLHVGRTIRADRILLTDVGNDSPLVTVSQLVVIPNWEAVLSGRVRVSSVTADEILVTGDPRPGESTSAPAPRAMSRRASWLVDEFRLPRIVFANEKFVATAAIGARSVSPDGLVHVNAIGQSANPRFRFSVAATDVLFSFPLARGRWRLEGDGSISAQFLTSLGFDSAVLDPLPGDQNNGYAWEILAEKGETEVSIGGELRSEISDTFFAAFSAGIGLQNAYSITDGSKLVVRGLRIAAGNPADLFLEANGDLVSGYRLNFKRAGLIGDLLLSPSGRSASFTARGVCPPFGGIESMRMDLQGELVESEGDWRARLSGRTIGTISMAQKLDFVLDGKLTAKRRVDRRAETVGDMAWLSKFFESRHNLLDLEGWVVTGVVTEANFKGGKKKKRWSVEAGGFSVGVGEKELFVRRNRAAIVTFGGRAYQITGDYIESGGRGAVRDLDFAGIPMKISVARSGLALQSANLELGPVKLTELTGILPKDLANILSHSEVDGELSARLVYDATQQFVDGELRADVRKFRYPTLGIEVDNLAVRVPVSQALVDPGMVKFDDANRYPDIPANISIDRIGRRNVAASGVTGKAYFSDYVLRAWDISFDLLGANAKSIFVLDPFRRNDGKWSSIIELDIDDLSLKKAYTGFVGEGRAAESVSGGVSAFAQAHWLDAAPDTFYLWLESTGRGAFGGDVIKALNEMQVPSARLPAIGLLFLGDYEYESLLLRAFLPPDKSDIVARLEVSSPNESLLKGIKIDAPLYTILRGLPFQIAAEINRAQ